jgi:arylsulfatase A
MSVRETVDSQAKNRRRRLCMHILGFACLFLTPAAAGEAREKNFVRYRASSRVQVISKLLYARYGAKRLFLDLYLPLPRAKKRPGAVVVRGGGWLVGDRKRFAHVASALAERGVASACIEYRTADESPYPAAVQDVKAAVRWMRANADQYGIDPEVVGTMGGSSGAYMALLVGLTPGIAEFEGHGGNGGTSSAVQGVVTMAAPSNLLTLTQSNQLTVGKFLRATPEQDIEKWQWASPLTHVRSDSPPVLLLHGAGDDSVPPSQSIDLQRQYRQAGASAEVYILDGAPHAFWNYHPWFDDAMDRAARFFLHLAARKKTTLVNSGHEAVVNSSLD